MRGPNVCSNKMQTKLTEGEVSGVYTFSFELASCNTRVVYGKLVCNTVTTCLFWKCFKLLDVRACGPEDQRPFHLQQTSGVHCLLSNVHRVRGHNRINTSLKILLISSTMKFFAVKFHISFTSCFRSGKCCLQRETAALGERATRERGYWSSELTIQKWISFEYLQSGSPGYSVINSMEDLFINLTRQFDEQRWMHRYPRWCVWCTSALK